MKIIKKHTPLLIFLLLMIVPNSYCMEPQPKGKKTAGRKIIDWVNIIGNVMLGNGEARDLLLPQNNTNPRFSFTNLPKEIQSLIIQLLVQGTNNDSVNVAIQAINSLSLVNHELNTLINNPQFCLRIIKYLARKFNITDETVTLSLNNVAEAKHRYRIQLDLANLCCKNDVSQAEFDTLYNKGIDVDFSFWDGTNTTTPLIAACRCNNLRMINLLLQKKATVDLTNIDGNTALLQSVLSKASLLDPIKLLLSAGANPELANKDGLTPLQAAQKTGNQPIITIITKAIKEKHDKK